MPNYKLVLVDDEPEVLRALQRELYDFADEHDLDLIAYDSPLVALEEIKKMHESIAMIISDQKMPEMKGCDLLNSVRKINPNIVAILLTAHTDIEDIIKTIKAELYSFILKPWDVCHLIIELEKGLETFKLKVDNENYIKKLNEELKWSGELQKKLLKITLPLQTKAIFSVAYNPLEQYGCGGDYYDIVQIDDNRFIALIGDVAGHGVKAAFITFILKTLLRELTRQVEVKNPPTPATLLAWLNNRLCEELENTEAIFVTFAAVLIDLKAMNLTVSNAGHVPIKIIEDNKISDIKIAGMALGIEKDIMYQEVLLPIKSKTRIVLLTDGVDEIDFDIKSADDILLSHSGSSEFTDLVSSEFHSLTKKSKRVDDVTLISIEIL